MCVFYARKGKSMKHNKILGLVGIAAALTLVACGGDKKSTAPGKTSAKVTSKAPVSRAPVSREPVPTATIESQLLEKRADGKVYFKVTGKVANYAAGALKWAWGLAEGENFVYGKAAPEATDFTALTFDANNAFSTELCLTDIQNIPVGVYHIYGGDTAATYAEIEIEDTTFAARDSRYDYFMRTDQSATGIAIEDLGPFSSSEASVVKDPDTDHTGLWLKVGGTQSEAREQSVYDAWNTKLDFQRMSRAGGYQKTTNTEFFWKVEGTKAYLYISLSQLVNALTSASSTDQQEWMTHLTANASGNVTPGKLLTTVSIMDVEYPFADENVKITIHSDITKGQPDGDEEFYGALGVKVAYINVPAPVDGGEQA